MVYFLFLLGVLGFLVAQTIRALRWKSLLPSDAEVSNHRLLLYVSLGSISNAFLPFHLGDFLRVLLLTSNNKVKLSNSLSSTIVERISDIFAILLVVSIGQLFSFEIQTPPLLIIMVSAIVLTLFLLVAYSSWFRWICFETTVVFNQRYQLLILDFIWQGAYVIRRVRTIRLSYLINTLIMWSFYVFSYYCLSRIVKLELFDVWTMLHSDPEISTYTSLSYMTSGNLDFYAIMSFLIFPIAATIFYSFYRIRLIELPNNSGVRQLLLKTVSLFSNPIHEPFAELNAYNYFLIVHFSGKRNIVGKIGASGFADCKIVKFFLGGSDAITALVSNNKLIIRKVVLPKSKLRLSEQFHWLKRAKQLGLHVPDVQNWKETSQYVYYEMPYDNKSVELYEWLSKAEEGERLLAISRVLNEISAYHQKTMTSRARPDLLDDYLQEKVLKNINGLKKRLSEFFILDSFYINGEFFSFDEWDFLYDLDLLKKFIQDTFQTDIHGDLTIDNIVINSRNDIFFIDPNPSTLFKTTFMDYAKLGQSLHFGYEAYLSDSSCVYNDNKIFFDKKYPSFYKKMYEFLISRVRAERGSNAIREFRVHEIIHYLRLLSYKFNISKETGILFFAITCELIREFNNDYIANKSDINRF